MHVFLLLTNFMKNITHSKPQATKLELHRFVDLSSFPAVTNNPLEFVCASCSNRVVLCGCDEFWKVYVLTRINEANQTISYYCCSLECGQAAKKTEEDQISWLSIIGQGIQGNKFTHKIPSSGGEITSMDPEEYEAKRLRSLVARVVNDKKPPIIDDATRKQMEQDCQFSIFYLLDGGLIPFNDKKTHSEVAFFALGEDLSRLSEFQKSTAIRNAINAMNDSFKKYGIEYWIDAYIYHVHCDGKSVTKIDIGMFKRVIS